MLYKEIIYSGEYKSVQEIVSEYNINRRKIDELIKFNIVEFVENEDYFPKGKRDKLFIKMESFRKWVDAFNLLYPKKTIKSKNDTSENDNEEIKDFI